MDSKSTHRNIWIIGPQSTGKTTLVNALDQAFASSESSSAASCIRPVVIREVARTVLRTQHYTRNDITNSPSRALELQKLILEAQYTAEESALNTNQPYSWFISDRSGLDPIVYAKVFVGDRTVQELTSSDQWRTLEQRMKNGLVVLCEAGCTWLVDDGTRLMPKNLDDWMRVDTAFHEMLKTVAIDKIVIPKTLTELQERVQVVLDALYARKSTLH
jgi:nicotinamide riboside kinase